MKIGKYEVVAGAFGHPETGYQGHVMTTWGEGSETRRQPHYFYEWLPTEDEAIEHAYRQARLRVENGEW